MIEIENRKLDENGKTTDFLVIIEDSFNGKKSPEGYIQMDAFLNKDSNDCDEIVFAWQTDLMESVGDYLPLVLDKEETKKMIDWLQSKYNLMNV